MEAVANQSWMSNWTMKRMYEKNTDCTSTFVCDYPLLETNVMSVWPSGKFAFVDWAGHGSPVSSHIYGIGAPAFITSSDCNSLNDEYPAIIFADACSNSDTDEVNIGQAMLKRGAVGFVGATKVALGCPGWDNPKDGSTQSLDYYFTTMVTSTEYTQGAALQKALRTMYSNHLWDAVYYEMFEWGALWGNPNLGLSSHPEYPLLELGEVTAGVGIQAGIKNTGNVPLSQATWIVSITGGVFGRIHTTVTGDIFAIAINEEFKIDSGALTKFNFGKVDISLQALNIQKTYSAVVIGPFILQLKEVI